MGNPVTEPEIELFKVQWWMLHVALNKIKLSMLRALDCCYLNYLCSADRMKVERMSRNVSVFDDCNLSNVKCISKIRILSDLNLDFDKKKYAVLFDTYARFRKAY